MDFGLDFDFDDCDDYTPVQPIRMQAEGKSWEAANIDIKQEGKWMIFIDGKTKKPLNEPPPISKENFRPRKYYHRKGDCDTSRSIPESKPFEPPQDNYTAFRPRKHYVVAAYEPPQNDRYKNIEDVDISQLPKQINTHKFKGDDPYRNPFRVSTKVINERRMKEAAEIIAKGQKKRAPKTSRKKLPSLFQRSIADKPKRFEL